MGGDSEALRHRCVKPFPFATKRSQKSDEVLEPNHEGPIPGSESNRERYRARAERDQGAPLCDSFARRGRGLDREWSRSASLRVTVSRSRNCSGPNHPGFVQDIETHHVLEEYKGSSFCWLSSLTWGKSSPTQYFLLGCLLLDVDTSL